MYQPSTRAQIVTRRTYNRPLNEAGTEFETWDQTVQRVISHQQWLWERAKGSSLTDKELEELSEFKQLMLERKVSVSGRTLWLGGTDVSKTRESSQFNCSFGRIETVHDVVDAFWLLLQGCGVGFDPVIGVLSGFTKKVEVRTIRSTRTEKGGYPKNKVKTYQEGNLKVWHLTVGDSAEAWAKVAGKVIALKDPVDVVVLDYSEIRPAGERLKGYGWISSGDESFSKAMEAISSILNECAGKLLTRMNILDILTWLGTTLSSRRSAEIAVMSVTDPEIDEFILAKKDWWLHNNAHRQQSNNSILFHTKPTKWELNYIFQKIQEGGGSEPGFINAAAAKKRAPWFKGVNPCAEILLGNKSFCNLVEVDWGKYVNSDYRELQQAVYLAARANYRQTCVNLDDGILQRTWHELNEFLRLCGVGATGIIKYVDAHTFDAEDRLKGLQESAQAGAYDMADELGMSRPKAVTTVKPSGTLSKIMDTTEGVHKPLGKYIFNNVTFSKHDSILPTLKTAGYLVWDKPYESDSVLVRLPASYEDVVFDVVDGKEVNLESAVTQLNRYRLLMDNYVDHNCSVTISYDKEEVSEIVDWIYDNWDHYVGVSFIYRNDPTKTAEDLGYPYLPQEIVTRVDYEAYTNSLLPIDLSNLVSTDDLADEACSTGACPIR